MHSIQMHAYVQVLRQFNRRQRRHGTCSWSFWSNTIHPVPSFFSLRLHSVEADLALGEAAALDLSVKQLTLAEY